MKDELDVVIAELGQATREMGQVNGQLAAHMNIAVVMHNPAADEARLEMLKQLIKRRRIYTGSVVAMTNQFQGVLEKLR